MWICRLLHKSFSSANLAAVSTEKTKLQALVAKLISSGQFSRETDVIPFENSTLFNFHEYFQHFSSITTGSLTSFGQTVLVADKIPTTMKFLDGCNLLSNGIVVIAREQTEGQGRGSNQWTSPIGCALFTIHFDINLQSLLGQRLSLLQLLASAAVIEAIEKTPEYKALDVKIKWPNDIFIGKNFDKLAGILATSSICENVAQINLGMGVNISNSQPSVCINDAVDKQNLGLTHFTIEAFIGRTVGYFEKWVSQLSQANMLQATISIHKFYQFYESHWMHQNQEVFVDKWQEKVTIVGIDEYGFLKVRRSSSGDIVTLHTDAHSFDVRQSIIREKAM